MYCVHRVCTCASCVCVHVHHVCVCTCVLCALCVYMCIVCVYMCIVCIVCVYMCIVCVYMCMSLTYVGSICMNLRDTALVNLPGYLPTSLLLNSIVSKGILGGAGEEGCIYREGVW